MKPMLAKTGDEDWLVEIETDRDWIATRKWDGIRLIFFLNNTGNRLLTRSSQNIIKKNPQFQKIIRELDGTILDSEGITSSDYLGDVQSLLQRDAPSTRMRLVVFDILRYKGQKLTQLPFSERRAYLRKAYSTLRKYKLPVRLEKFIRKGKKAFYKKVVKAKGEGVVTKDLQASYTPGKRTRAWIKVKPRNTYEFVILGFTKGSGKYSNQVGAIKYGALYEGELTEIGRSSGMTDRERLDMTRNPGRYIGKVAEFEAQEITRSGAMRHPEYIGLRLDLRPRDIQLETYL